MQLHTSVRDALAVPPSSRRGPRTLPTPYSVPFTQAQRHPAGKCGSWNMTLSVINVHALPMNPFPADVNHSQVSYLKHSHLRERGQKAT